jgi:hypothetical protein
MDHQELSTLQLACGRFQQSPALPGIRQLKTYFKDQIILYSV